MGMVFKAFDLALKRTVALKRLELDPDLPSEYIYRRKKLFIQEARTASNLNHPNIVSVYDVFEYEGDYYIPMEYVEGDTLSKYLGGNYQIQLDTFLYWMKQVAQALDYAHRMGVIHRDIKPSNIMISREGKAKIMDFGVARIIAGRYTTMELKIAGSRGYMSPEQVRGDKVDGRSDIFSLGVILYQALTGHFPFQCDTLESFRQSVLQENPPGIKTFNPNISDKIEWIIMTCLAKKPEERFRTAGELAREIRETYRPTISKRKKHNKRLTYITLVILFILLIVFLIFQFSSGGNGEIPDGGGGGGGSYPTPEESDEKYIYELKEVTNDGAIKVRSKKGEQARVFSGYGNIVFAVDESKTNDLPFGILALRRNGLNYDTVSDYENFRYGELIESPTVVKLAESPDAQVLFSIVSKEDTGEGYSVIGYKVGDKINYMDTCNLSNYPLRVDDLDKKEPVELLAYNYIASTHSFKDRVIVSEIYRFEPSIPRFENVSSDFPSFYQKLIDKLISQITEKKSADFIEKRVTAIIYAKKLMGHPDVRLDPQETLKKFFNYCNRKETLEAYMLLSKPWHEWQLYSQFSKALKKGKLKAKVSNSKVEREEHNYRRIKCEILYHNVKGNIAEKVPIVYEMVKEDGIWKIDRGTHIDKGAIKKNRSVLQVITRASPSITPPTPTIVLNPSPSTISTGEEQKTKPPDTELKEFLKNIRDQEFKKAWKKLSLQSACFVVENLVKRLNQDPFEVSERMKEGGEFARRNFWDELISNDPSLKSDISSISISKKGKRKSIIILSLANSNQSRKVILRRRNPKKDKSWKVAWIESTLPVGYTLQVASFKDENRADVTCKQVKKLGYKPKKIKSGKWTKVVTGVFPDYEAAETAGGKFHRYQHDPIVRLVNRGEHK